MQTKWFGVLTILFGGVSVDVEVPACAVPLSDVFCFKLGTTATEGGDATSPLLACSDQRSRNSFTLQVRGVRFHKVMSPGHRLMEVTSVVFY